MTAWQAIRRTIRGEDLHSKCEWTAFEGTEGVFPLATIRGGEVVYEDPNEKPIAG